MTKVGILGGGQLAQMMTQSAISLAIETAIFERKPDSPASRLTHHHSVGEWDDIDTLLDFARGCDVLTLENEFIYASSLEKLENAGYAVYPSSTTLEIIQDKLLQKRRYQECKLAVPHFSKVDSVEEIRECGEAFGYPLVLKARYGGYDGYGNFTIETEQFVELGWKKLGGEPGKLMVEAFVPFTKELAVMVARSRNDEVKAYPVVETIQKNHICHVVRAPADLPDDIAQQATQMAIEAVNGLYGVGIFGVELFLLSNNEILLNEMAPRPHNSGHYTMEGCVTSQFENHLRAVLGLPLGDTSLVKPVAVMVNALGEREGTANYDNLHEALKFTDAHVHLYGKRDVRIGRKMGHVTVLGDDIESAEARARQVVDTLEL